MTRGWCVRTWFAALLVAAVVGCKTRSLSTDGPIGDATAFQPTREVDILFMIDNTAGTLAQNNLRSNFPRFIEPLMALPGGLPNLHLAVITSDLGAGDGSIETCDATGGQNGIFQYAAAPGARPCETHLQPGATYISNNGVPNYTGNIEDAFACMADVGESGCAFEQPLASIARALGADGRPAPAQNQGFLRQGALLLIVLLTDEDDCSVPDGSDLFDTSAGLDIASPLGPLDFRCNEFGHLCNGARPPRRAPTGSLTDVVALENCTSAESAGMLTPVATLRAQLRALKAYPDQQILVAAITGSATPYEVTWKTPTTADTSCGAPSCPWPDIAHSCTSSDGSYADPAVRINQWVSAFGPNGQTFTICDTDFSPALQAIAQHLADRIPPPEAMP